MKKIVIDKKYVMAFPGIFLITLGLIAILFPKLIIFLIATTLIALGCAAMFVAWKFYQFKQQADKVFNSFKSQSFEIRSFSLDNINDFEEEKPRKKPDIIIH